MYEKLEKLTERLLSNLHSSNLLNTVLYISHWLTQFVELRTAMQEVAGSNLDRTNTQGL